MAIFYFSQDKTHYFLSDSLGRHFWHAWPKSQYTVDQAISLADSKVGEYTRTHAPREVKYIIQPEE